MPLQEPAPPQAHAFLDPDRGSVTYVVFDHRGGHCAIVDPVPDYDGKAGRTRTASVQVNIRAGDLPPRDGNGVAYQRIPVNGL